MKKNPCIKSAIMQQLFQRPRREACLKGFFYGGNGVGAIPYVKGRHWEGGFPSSPNPVTSQEKEIKNMSSWAECN